MLTNPKSFLSWIQPATIKYADIAQNSLETYSKKCADAVNPPSGSTEQYVEKCYSVASDAIAKAGDSIRKINYALKAVQCSGGHALSSELAIIVALLRSDDLPPGSTEASLLALMSGLVTIGNYISMVADGAPDYPGILSKQINELRACRNAPLMLEDNLLPPSFTFTFIRLENKVDEISDSEISSGIEESAKLFQVAFSEWIGNQRKEHLNEMRTVLQKLQAITRDDDISNFWWAGEAIIDALHAGVIRAQGNVIAQIRTISVGLQRYRKDGSLGARDALGAERFKSLLYFLSSIKKPTHLVSEVLNTFNVADSLEEESVRGLRTALEAAKTEALTDVIPEVRSLLDAAMVSLGRAHSASKPEVFSGFFKSFLASLRGVSSVFYVVNEQELVAIATGALKPLEGIQQRAELTDSVIDKVKESLLYLESRLIKLTENKATEHLKVEGVDASVLEALVGELLQEINKGRKALGLTLDGGGSDESLRDSLTKLVNVASSLSFVGSKRLASIVEATARAFIHQLESGTLSDSSEFKAAARSLVAVEMYLEAIVQKVSPSESLLPEAEKSLSVFGYDPVSTNTELPASQLLKRFMEAKNVGEALVEPGDMFLSELFELRVVYEHFLLKGDVTNKDGVSAVYLAADKMSQAARIREEDSLQRIASAIAHFCKAALTHLSEEDYPVVENTNLLRSALETAIRCTDEISVKGKCNLFTSDLANKLVNAHAVFEMDDVIVEEVVSVEDTETELGEVSSAVETVVEVSNGIDPAADWPEWADPQLISLFRGEYLFHQERVVSACSPSDGLKITPEILRSVHTMRGCSGSAECKPLHLAFSRLEDKLNQLGVTTTLTLESTTKLLTIISEAQDFQEKFPWVTSTLQLDAWVDEIDSLESRAGLCGDADNLIVHSVVPSVEVDNPVQSDSLPTESFNPGSDAVPQFETVSLAFNKDMAEFYLDEADEVIPKMKMYLADWLGDVSDKELTASIKRCMHTLKGAALMAEHKSLSDIFHGMESLFENIGLGLLKPDTYFEELLQTTLEVIDELTSGMHRANSYTEPSLLLNCINSTVWSNTVDLNLLIGTADSTAVESTHSDVAAETQASTSHESPAAESAPVSTADPVGEATVSGSTDEDHLQSIEATQTTQTSQPKKRRSRRGGRGRGNRQPTESDFESAASDDEPQSLTLGTDEPLPPQGIDLVGVHQGDSPEVDPTLTVSVETAADVVEESLACESSSTEDSAIILTEPEPEPEIEVQVEVAASATARALIHEPRLEAVEPASSVTHSEPKASEADQVQFSSDPLFSDTYELADGRLNSRGLIRHIESVRKYSESREITRQSGSTDKIRIDQSLLDNAVTQASELIASGHRQEGLHQEMSILVSTLRDRLDTMQLAHNQFITLLRSQINSGSLRASTSIAFDKFQEQFNDLSTLSVSIGSQIGQLSQDVIESLECLSTIRDSSDVQGKLLRGLQNDLLDSRVVPFLNLKSLITQQVDKAASALGKTVNVTFFGMDVIMDKIHLDEIKTPLTHILKNAVDHGIESADQRRAAGKPPAGLIEVSVKRRAKNIVVCIKDDGRGIDSAIVRKKAVEKGLISSSESLSEREIFNLITKSGFSTATTVTSISGRGVGMDIVASTIAEMGGHLLIDSTFGEGTMFTLEVPFTVGANRALIVRAGNQAFALPTYLIRHVLNVSRRDIEAQIQQSGLAFVEHEEQIYDISHLADIIAMPDLKKLADSSTTDISLVLCEWSGHTIAVQVDRIDSMPEIHIRKISGILSMVRGITGSTELHDGTPAFVLDLPELVRVNLKKGESGYQVKSNRIRAVRIEDRPFALIVDDANSYRKLLTTHFDSRGFKVFAARDGQDAIDNIPYESIPNIIVVDYEMPRLNGIELVQQLRAIPEFSSVPIIMLTTRQGEIEGVAYEAGVNIFLNKPCRPDVMDAAIAELLPSFDLQVPA